MKDNVMKTAKIAVVAHAMTVVISASLASGVGLASSSFYVVRIAKRTAGVVVGVLQNVAANAVNGFGVGQCFLLKLFGRNVAHAAPAITVAMPSAPLCGVGRSGALNGFVINFAPVNASSAVLNVARAYGVGLV